MTLYIPHHIQAWSLILILCGTLAHAQDQSTKEAYKPEPFQDGKDVVWLPTEDLLVETMLDMAKVTAEDYVIDLGSGDGRTVIAAAKRGARAMGIEYNPELVEMSKRLINDAGVSDRVQIVEGDLFETDLSQASVITMFLLPDLNLKLRPKILKLKPGTRVVSNSFDMEKWRPDKTIDLEDCEQYCTAHFWVVPARIEGVWATPGGRLRLKQEFQMVNGEFIVGGRTAPISRGILRGDELSFRLNGVRYVGHVAGDSIDGTAELSGQEKKWMARRTPE